jgi:hypothetical protein
VDVDARGIRSATGRLALPTAAADYPLRTAKQAFDDLGNGPRPMLAPYCGPLPMGSGGAELGAPQPAPASAPVAQAPGPMPCPTPKPVAITAATIGLLLTWEGTQGGSALLVPAWFFTTAGSDYPVVTIAIDPHYLGSPSGPSGPAGSTAPSGSAGPAGPAGNVTSSAVP